MKFDVDEQMLEEFDLDLGQDIVFCGGTICFVTSCTVHVEFYDGVQKGVKQCELYALKKVKWFSRKTDF